MLVRGLTVIEGVVAMPDRLGAPLPEPAPSTADPIILVSGFANTASPGWDSYRKSLEADGFTVYVVDFRTHGLGDMYEAAQQLAAFIDEVKRKTARSKVDLVGFSEGGVLSRMVVAQYGRAADVDRIVTIATPHNGVEAQALYGVASNVPFLGAMLPESAGQLIEGSRLITNLTRDDAALRAGGPVRYASIHSRTFDGATSPVSARLPGALDVSVDFKKGDHRFWLFGFGGPNHFDMYHYSSPAFEALRALLLDRDSDIATIQAIAGVSFVRAR